VVKGELRKWAESHPRREDRLRLSKHPAVVAEGAEQAVAAQRDTRFKPTAGLLDNTPITTGRYIAHIAVPCRDLEEAARWYAEVLGHSPCVSSRTRVTFSFGGVLQLVCHLERRAIAPNPRAYPRHHGLPCCIWKIFPG